MGRDRVTILKSIDRLLEMHNRAFQILLIVDGLLTDEIGEKCVAQLVLFVRVGEKEVHIELLILFFRDLTEAPDIKHSIAIGIFTDELLVIGK
jgi:NADH:ubiquinone oxidoreductase subunit K